MRIIRKESRPIMRIDEYKGTCHYCQGAVELMEPFIVIPLYRKEDGMVVAPIDWLECPHCHNVLSTMHFTGDRLFQTKLVPPKQKGLN